MISLGLGTVVGGNGSSFGGFTPEYVTLLSKATSLNYQLPTSANQANQNKLIVDLKAAGVWDKLDVFYMFANTGSKEFALLNWKNPNSFNASAVGSMTWNSSGYIGASNSSLNSNWNPTTNAVNFSQNNATIGVWKRTHDATANKYLWGNSGARSYVLGVNSANARLHTTTGLASNFNTTNTGMLVFNRTAASGTGCVTLAVNTTITTTNQTSGTTATPDNANYSVFGVTGLAGDPSYLGQLSAWWIGSNLVTEINNSSLYNALNTYIATT
jgi:hypothetical protein